MAENNGEGTTVIALGKLGKVLGWAVLFLASVMGAQFFAFRAFSSSDMDKLRLEVSKDQQLAMAQLSKDLVTTKDLQLIVQKWEAEGKDRQKQIDDLKQLITRHVDQAEISKGVR